MKQSIKTRDGNQAPRSFPIPKSYLGALKHLDLVLGLDLWFRPGTMIGTCQILIFCWGRRKEETSLAYSPTPQGYMGGVERGWASEASSTPPRVHVAAAASLAKAGGVSPLLFSLAARLKALPISSHTRSPTGIISEACMASPGKQEAEKWKAPPPFTGKVLHQQPWERQNCPFTPTCATIQQDLLGHDVHGSSPLRLVLRLGGKYRPSFRLVSISLIIKNLNMEWHMHISMTFLYYRSFFQPLDFSRLPWPLLKYKLYALGGQGLLTFTFVIL